MPSPDDDAEDAESALLRSILRPVPAPPPDPRPVALTSVLVSTVAARDTQSALQLLGAALPLPPDLSHLKRVRRLGGSREVLLGHAGAWEALPTPAATGLLPLGLLPRSHAVPAGAPETARELARWAAHWPCVLRARAAAPPPRAGELRRAAALLRQALALADGAARADARAAALLAEPATGAVVARAVDASGRGDAPPGAAGARRIEHAALRCVGAVGAPHVARARRASAPARYLATGLDCFLAREPCPMCAMALVHARVLRAFYARPAPAVGGFSHARVHCEPRLNHRFEVFCLPVHTLDAADGAGVPPEGASEGTAAEETAPGNGCVGPRGLDEGCDGKAEGAGADGESRTCLIT